jgi:hypothetical protein
MSVFFVEKMLAQTANPGTTAVTHYTKVANKITVVKRIIVANNTAAASTFTIHFSNSSATYTTSNVLYYQVPIAANATVELDTFIALNTTSGTIGVAAGAASTLVFTSFGVEIQEA